MKSIEEKARAYDKAIERARVWKEKSGMPADRQGILDDIFPELNESEDERIRERLINLVKSHIEWLEDRIKEQLSNGQVYGEELNEAKDAIAWLEKQCQVKDSAIYQHENETCKENGNSLTSEDIRKGLIQYFSTFTLNTFAGIDPKKILSWLEKQGEQKPKTIFLKFRIGDKVTNGEDTYTINFIGKDCYWVKEHDCATIPFEYQHNWKLVEQNHTDKIELKFKIGDWVVFNNKHQSIYQVEKIEDGYYILRHTHGGTLGICVLHDESLRLWDITKDAKDGDILATDKSVFIYAKVLYNKPYAYCGVDKFSVFKDNCLEHDWANSVDNIHPATKEQRDTLMKAMTKAGYTFDFKKKELKKVEQNPNNNQFTPEQADILDKHIDKFVEQNPAWSEEDERLLQIKKNIENICHIKI